MAITQEVMDELNHGMKINSNIEEEHHYLELEIKEYKKGMGVRIHQKGIEENDIKSEMDNLSIKIGGNYCTNIRDQIRYRFIS